MPKIKNCKAEVFLLPCAKALSLWQHRVGTAVP